MSNEYVYLPELDSVRLSKKDQMLAEEALFREIVVRGNIVVLSYNQIIDSIMFMHIIENEKNKQAILYLVKSGRILVNQFKPDLNISKYIQTRLRDKNFICTYLTFIDNHPKYLRRYVMKKIADCIQYDNFEYFKSIIACIKRWSLSDRDRVEKYALYLLDISRSICDHESYIDSEWLNYCNPQKLQSVMNEMLPVFEKMVLLKGLDIKGKWLKLIKKMEYYATNERSKCYRFIDDEKYSIHDTYLLKELVDVAYNITIQSSIPHCVDNIKMEKAMYDTAKRCLDRIENSVNDYPEIAQVKYRWGNTVHLVSSAVGLTKLFQKNLWLVYLPFVFVGNLLRVALIVGLVMILNLIELLLKNEMQIPDEIIFFAYFFGEQISIWEIFLIALFVLMWDIITSKIKKSLPKWASSPMQNYVINFCRDAYSIAMCLGYYYRRLKTIICRKRLKNT